MNPMYFSRLSIATVTLLVGSAVAQTQSGGKNAFRFSRTFEVTQPGPQRLAIDLELLAGTQPTLSDLRLFDANSTEVAYLIVPQLQSEPQWRDAQALARIVADKGSSGFEADLGKLLDIDQIGIRGLPPPILKRVRVEASGDRRRYTLLADDETLFDLPEEGLSRMTVSLPQGSYRYLRVIWNDRETLKLPLPERVNVRLSHLGRNAQPTKAPVPFELSSNRTDVTQYRIQLPSKLLPIDALLLETEQPQLMRHARVSEARATNGGLDAYVLGTGTLRRALHSGLVADDLRVKVERPLTAAMVVTIENANNPPIAVKQVYAELAPQPFIYFEARQVGQYAAYFGADKQSDPHYDLEAERDSAQSGVVSEARWKGPRIARSGAPIASTLRRRDESLMHGSVLYPQQFRFSRTINWVGESMARLPLDAAVLAHSQGLADVRILNSQNQQIPYVLERETDPFIVNLSLNVLPASARPKQFGANVSLYGVELPYSNLPEGKLIVTTASHVFQRHVTLLKPGPKRPGKPLELLEVESTNWVDLNEGVEAAALELAVPAGTNPNLLLVIEDGDNVPLAKLSCRLQLPGRSLRFFHTGTENLTLYYGSADLGPPSYDLSLLTQEIEQLPSLEFSLGDEKEQSLEPSKVTRQAKWFWGILVLTALSLVALIAKLLRRA